MFKDVEVIAHWNENDYQGQVGTCVKFTKGKFKGKYAIYNDYYGSCSGCDSWENATGAGFRVLVGCEESQTVCKAFRELGIEAYSCDLQECSGGHPEWHLQMDLFKAIELIKPKLGIFHPPCTFISRAGARWINVFGLVAVGDL